MEKLPKFYSLYLTLTRRMERTKMSAFCLLGTCCAFMSLCYKTGRTGSVDTDLANGGATLRDWSAMGITSFILLFFSQLKFLGFMRVQERELGKARKKLNVYILKQS